MGRVSAVFDVKKANRGYIPVFFGGRPMLTGAHVVIYSKDAAADRTFFRDVLRFPSVDAGNGWLIFALPHTEAAFHPLHENNKHEMYFTCDDLSATMAALRQSVCASAKSWKRSGEREPACCCRAGKLACTSRSIRCRSRPAEHKVEVKLSTGSKEKGS